MMFSKQHTKTQRTSQQTKVWHVLLSQRDYSFLFQVHFGVAWRTGTHWYSVEYMLNHASQLYCMDSAKRGTAVYSS